MIKKLLILPLIGGIISFGAFASADTVDGFTSDGVICKTNIYDGNNSPSALITNNILSICQDNTAGFPSWSSDDVYYCFGVTTPNSFYADEYLIGENRCLPASDYHSSDADYWFYANSDNTDSIVVNGYVYVSYSPITAPSQGGGSDDSSSIVPSIPSSFTSGITALVSNFGSILVGWLPTIILVALGITAIFALFRVVRNYARSSFNG